MKRRRLLQFAGLGSVGLILSTADRTLFARAIQNERRDRLNLQPFEFDVPTVDKTGTVRRSQMHSASFLPVSLAGADRLDMVSIAPANFWMGASHSEFRRKPVESPRRRVRVSPFLISKYPITQSQWTAVATLPAIRRDLSTNPSHFQGRDRPVESVSWLDAVEFCDRLSQHSGRRFQLPTEAQWEYACRAGTQTPFHTGETIASQFANYVGTSIYKAEPAGDYLRSTAPVGSYKPNAFGLHDMHGNVWEWCADTWHRNYRNSPKNQRIVASNRQPQLRAIRGGSWLDSPDKTRSASRSKYLETDLNRTIGFRVIMT
ncbi:MAG: formylglycine-generating enzyme family protein [Cyanobacteria bacterium J06597_1]